MTNPRSMCRTISRGWNIAPGVPTRPLDRFERFGLGTLRQGQDLFIATESDGLRMIGAVRSTSQCVVCHDCQRGDLLGAFTYTLKRDAEEIVDKAEKPAEED